MISLDGGESPPRHCIDISIRAVLLLSVLLSSLLSWSFCNLCMIYGMYLIVGLLLLLLWISLQDMCCATQCSILRI